MSYSIKFRIKIIMEKNMGNKDVQKKYSLRKNKVIGLERAVI